MRQPFWIVNSALLLLALIVAGFIYMSRPTMPERVPVEPAPYRAPKKTETSSFNISKIYEYDLFDTYQKEYYPAETPEQLSPLPEPPPPMSLRIPEEPRPQFIEPLPVTLKGIVVVRTDDTKNRAIIMDNRTNKELSYRVGDMIEDAQLVRIFSNKIILMRSNGQQEVLYLREKDAKIDPAYANTQDWIQTIRPISQNNYAINTAEFVNRIQSLGQFIDTLELTSAYKQGQSIGARVANTAPGSLGQALGITKEDIILSINDIPVSQTQSRLAIYNQIINLKNGTVIPVTLVRNNREITLHYTLEEVAEVGKRKQDVGIKPIASNEINPEQRKQLEDKHSFAPTLQEIRTREKNNMLEKGKRPTQNVLSNLNE